MTDPVILLGTQSNGETLPVQVDGFGRLVAEGLQGSEGPPGDQGPPGADGGSFPLPPDPYEGALLGWLNGELSWVGTPPVPIPPGVFGPITGWNAQDGLLTVDGEIPAGVGSGVYVWQCNQDGTYFTEGWNTSQVWSNNLVVNGVLYGTKKPSDGFDGNVTNPVMVNNVAEDQGFTFTPLGGIPYTSSVRVYILPSGTPGAGQYSVNGGAEQGITGGDGWTTLLNGTGNFTEFMIRQGSQANSVGFSAIEVDGKILVNTDSSLNLRVNQVLGQSLLGIPNVTTDFTIGKYLRVPEQRVAPWVLYGNDPTSLIDHLRSS